MNKKFYCMALGAFLGGILLTSCTNDLNTRPGGNSSVDYSSLSPVATPDAVVWSGFQTFGNTFDGTRSEGYGADTYSNSYAAATPTTGYKTRAVNENDEVFEVSEATATWNLKVWDSDISPSTFVSSFEWNGNYLPNNKNNKDKLIVEYLVDGKAGDVYEFFPISASTNQTHTLGVFYFTGPNKQTDRVDVEVWQDKDNTTSDLKGFKLTLKQDCEFGFYISGKTSNNEDITYYSLEELNEPQPMYQNESVTERQHAGILKQEDLKKIVINGTTIDMSGNTFISLEDWTDFDFNDFFLYVPGKVIAEPTEDDGKCKRCGHSHHGVNDALGSCDECNEAESGGCYLCPKDGCDHPAHEGDCPKCEEEGNTNSDCYPKCPVEDCGHPKHEGDCPQCEEEGNTNSDCYPKCPVEDCGHPKHDGVCEECEEGASSCHPRPGDTNCPVEGCDHPKHPGKDCPQCEEGTTCHPKQESTGGTTDPSNNEVEINLSLNDIHTLPNGSNKYDVADLVSKLSMHVRYPHDIEVIIPVPQSIYCDQDDLYIIQDHYVNEKGEPNWEYGGDKNEITYVIGGYVKDENGNITNDKASWTVKLGVEFIPASADELTDKSRTPVKDINNNDIKAGGYIRVYTDGICKELIDFLKDYYGDGINFEVYNYYNLGNQYQTGKYAEISYEKLQYNYLSHSLVNFDWNWDTKTHDGVSQRTYPDYFINAFHTVNMLPTKGDCYNWILGDEHANAGGVYLNNGKIHGSNTSVTWGDNTTQRSKFTNPYQGEHYNGSDLNWIYTLKTLPGAADEVETETMPAAPWPFVTAPWQYYKFGNSTTWNWGLDF